MFKHSKVREDRQFMGQIVLFISTFNSMNFSESYFSFRFFFFFPSPVFHIINYSLFEMFHSILMESQSSTNHFIFNAFIHFNYFTYMNISYCFFFIFSFQKHPEFNLVKYCHQTLLRSCQ